MNRSRTLRLALMTLVAASAASRADDPAARAKALVKRADDHLERNELDAAIADLDEAIRLDPGNVEYYEDRSRARTEKGLYVLAIEDSTGSSGSTRGGSRRISAAATSGPRGRIRGGTRRLRTGDRARPEVRGGVRLRAYFRAASATSTGRSPTTPRGPGSTRRASPVRSNRGPIWMRSATSRGRSPTSTRSSASRRRARSATSTGAVPPIRGGLRPGDRRLRRGDSPRPEVRLAYMNRGSCWRSKGEFDRAIADFDAVIRLGSTAAPSVAGFPFELGWTRRGTSRAKWAGGAQGGRPGRARELPVEDRPLCGGPGRLRRGAAARPGVRRAARRAGVALGRLPRPEVPRRAGGGRIGAAGLRGERREQAVRPRRPRRGAGRGGRFRRRGRDRGEGDGPLRGRGEPRGRPG